MEALEGWKRAQLFGGQPTTTQAYVHCVPYKLPAGIVSISPDYTVTLTAEATFTPQCTSATEQSLIDNDSEGVTSIADMKDPFHASITPQAYATGAATVISWMLVIMLLITPRTFFVGGASPRSGLMGRRGMIGGATGGGSFIGVGTRPWLQKVAALTVAISLTLATADTFKIAERQYSEGFMDAMTLRDEVVAGMEIKVSRVISDVFLWLAQVQTLIRLFPRHREKVIIKWIGFALILLDILFSSLNSFGPWTDKAHPRHFQTAIPALSYLFQLSLSMLYAAWVMYYAVTKRRYAFYHSMMWNISLVALLSMVAILTPVVFFITDISNYSIAGWGDYFRWVGAAAASVIVWEWVERIEALEREEKKDGILGREIYDGDEMLDTASSHEIQWPRGGRNSSVSEKGQKKPGDGGNSGGAAFTSGTQGQGFDNIANRLGRSINQRHISDSQPHQRRTIHIAAPPLAARAAASGQRADRDTRSYAPLPSPGSPPPVIASPVSRTDTTSADSTVYTIRYHPISDSPAIPRQPDTRGNGALGLQNAANASDPEKAIELSEGVEQAEGRGLWNWHALASQFRRKGRSPPPEVQRGRVIEPLGIDDVPVNIPPRHYTGLALKDRLGTFAAQQGEKFRSKKKVPEQPELNLPVTIIPAQPRGRTWSPDILMQQQQEQEERQQQLLEVSASTGLYIPSDSPRSVVDRANSTSPAVGTQDFADVAAGAPGSSSNRTPHITFASGTVQRAPFERRSTEADSNPSRPPTSVALGNEVPSADLGRAVEQRGSSDPPINRTQTPTNHDR